MGLLYLKWILGTLAFLTFILLIYHSQHLYRQFKSEAKKGLARTNALKGTILTEPDIAHLPEPVQKYLKYVGVLGKEKVKNLKAVIGGSMKPDKARGWSKVSVMQYSFFDQLTRLFFLKLNMSGLPVVGLHEYKNAAAMMLIKIAGLLTVADGKGPEMNKAETVTVLNDMCILAPASLIDLRIEWETIDGATVRAVFNNAGNKVSALLYFNEKGQLINFVSDDRYFSPAGTTYESVRWSTPVSNYKNINGMNLATYGEAIWHFPGEDFCYAKFEILDLEYNRKDM